MSEEFICILWVHTGALSSEPVLTLTGFLYRLTATSLTRLGGLYAKHMTSSYREAENTILLYAQSNRGGVCE